MRALDRKLWRDLVAMWGQAITIALVVACGIASFVTMRATHASLVSARDRHYAEQRFADVFAHVERAPDALAHRLEAIPGIARAHTRIVREVLLPMPDMPDPASGRIVSLPKSGQPPLNALSIQAGRLPDPLRDDEVVVLASFAEAHRLKPGDRIPAILNGHEKDLRVVGVALSPEFVFAVGGRSFVSDDRKFTVLWMIDDAAAPPFRMEGSFDDVVISLSPGAAPEAVIGEVKRLLEPYGVMFVHGRDRQISHRLLESELAQLGAYAVVTPAIFLGVAAFLVNVVLARTLHLQRGQIAMLKAIGYTNREIAGHYGALVSIVTVAGAALGVGLGDLLGRGMIGLYRPFFRFPDLSFSLDPVTVAGGVAISLVTGFAGAFSSVLRSVRVPPAEAMRPEAPAVYRRPFFERLGLHRIVGISGRMVLRELFRRPLRAALSCVGIAFATAVTVAGFFINDSMDALITNVFEYAQREDVEVSFLEPVSASVVREAEHLPGVTDVEPRRVLPVRIYVDQRERDTILIGSPPRLVPKRIPPLWPPRDWRPPADGVALSRKLAELLQVSPGENVRMEVLEGDRRTLEVPIAALVDDIFGIQAYATEDTIHRLLDEERVVTSLLLTVDRGEEEAVVARLATMRNVAGIVRRSETLAQFVRQTSYMWVTTTILTAFGAIIAFGIVYNQARIALSMRSRDLASLRVLGFTRAEISAVLLGELGFYVLVGIPLGFLFGRGLVDLIMSTVDAEGYRMPALVTARTYAFAAAATLVAALASALVVRRKLDRLDLIGVLKTRE